MEKEFIPYEQALALKQLGFESPYPIGGYQGGKVFYYENGKLYYDGRPMYSSDAHSGQLLAPLYQQAFRWFREKHKLHSIIYIQDVELDWYYYDILEVREGRYNNDLHNDMNFKSYKESELECLKKLIEIVKSK